MTANAIKLVWIVVKDLKSAIEFYTKTVGLTLKEHSPEFGWAELVAKEDGARLGLAQESEAFHLKAGSNAVPTVTVDNIETAKTSFLNQGVRLIGETMEVPGHVKLQTFQDRDGNTFQLVEMLS